MGIEKYAEKHMKIEKYAIFCKMNKKSKIMYF